MSAETDLALVRGLIGSALASLEANRHRIDDLNVYPVPDGDTGTNLTLTVRAVDEALRKDGPDDRAGLAHEVSRAALMGARGNSGVILSQIVRGATDSLAETDDLAKAFRSASDAAYRAVKKPVEGTMLTAIRALADAAERGSTLPEIVAAGDDVVAQTREMLPVLREAGVVDAGAAGLVEIVRGIAAVVAGEPLPDAPQLDDAIGIEAIHQELSRFRYCTVFVLEGRRTAVVAVAAGDGNRALFESGGAVVVDGGETMNPSTADLVAAIEGSDASEIVLLPNNKNVIMTAEQAA